MIGLAIILLYHYTMIPNMVSLGISSRPENVFFFMEEGMMAKENCVDTVITTWENAISLEDMKKDTKFNEYRMRFPPYSTFLSHNQGFYPHNMSSKNKNPTTTTMKKLEKSLCPLGKNVSCHNIA